MMQADVIYRDEDVIQAYKNLMEFARNFGHFPAYDFITLANGTKVTIEVLIDLYHLIQFKAAYPEEYESDDE